MEENLIDNDHLENRRRRTVFLTVLCILTWIGAAGVFVFNAYGFNENLKAQRLFGSSPRLTLLLWVTLINCSGSLISAAGSIYMWRLKKAGFYVYAVGQLAPLIFSAYVLAAANKNILSAPPAVSIVLLCWFVIPIGFLIMYGLQLKHLGNRAN